MIGFNDINPCISQLFAKCKDFIIFGHLYLCYNILNV